jgi:hypothetical protein
MRMNSALLFALLPFAVLVIGGTVIALNALRNAPEGSEDAAGFHCEEAAQPARISHTATAVAA